MTDQEKSYELLIRIDERLTAVLDRLSKGDERFKGIEEKQNNRPCQAVQEKVRAHDKILWAGMLGMVGLFFKAVWDAITR